MYVCIGCQKNNAGDSEWKTVPFKMPGIQSSVSTAQKIHSWLFNMDIFGSIDWEIYGLWSTVGI